mmetsp:Transcript_23917/g.50739  ORF Transcript_23917/g.50739 Transcript_23917/m.50739 type:complete len:148 (+) Transcript_23917:279-722(+)
MVFDSSTDFYLAVNSSVLMGPAACKVEPSGCASDQQWLMCANDMFNTADQTIGTFALPPDLIHSSCLSNPACIGISVANSGASGSLFQLNNDAQGWFALPNSFARGKPAVRKRYKAECTTTKQGELMSVLSHGVVFTLRPRTNFVVE